MHESTSEIIDPICGMIVDPATALHTEREGKMFYFCSESCQQKFLVLPVGVKPKAEADCCCD